MYNWGLEHELVEEFIVKLITEGFINEERFAKSYSRGKFRQNKWGKIKIKLGLSQYGLTDYCINQGLKEIEQEEYNRQLKSIAEKKFNSLKINDLHQKRKKTEVYLATKGYEYELIQEVLSALVAE